MPGDALALGKTQTLLHITSTNNVNTTPRPGDVSASGLPPLLTRVRHRWPFSQHTALLLWLTFKVRISGYKFKKDRDKANSAAFGLTKMQFFISNRPRKSQWPHISHSLPMRLMQQTHHHQAKYYELLFPVKVPCPWELCMSEWLAEVRAKVLECKE